MKMARIFLSFLLHIFSANALFVVLSSISRKISYLLFDAKLGNKACSNTYFGTDKIS